MPGIPGSTYDCRNVTSIRVSQRAFRRLSLSSAVSYALLVVTGGAVRLTGSGLGCPDWPSCYKHRLTAAYSFNAWIEFGNRLVTVVVSVLSIVVFLAAVSLRPRRRDVTWLAAGLLIGLAAQIVLGGLVVLFKLNPYLVALHFFLTLAVLGVAIVLYCLADPARAAHRPTPVVRDGIVWFVRLQFAVLVAVVLAGTVVTGSGPHAGNKDAKRIAIAFRDAAELHSTIALFLIGVTLGGLFALHLANAPGRIQRHAQLVLEIYAAQGVLGYLQYALHDNAAVVELHMLGATLAFGSTLLLVLACYGLGPAATDQLRTSRRDRPLVDERAAVTASPLA
jgi:cytochrome c oxidase assembly protein subunit 15